MEDCSRVLLPARSMYKYTNIQRPRLQDDPIDSTQIASQLAVNQLTRPPSRTFDLGQVHTSLYPLRTNPYQSLPPLGVTFTENRHDTSILWHFKMKP